MSSYISFTSLIKDESLVKFIEEDTNLLDVLDDDDDADHHVLVHRLPSKSFSPLATPTGPTDPLLLVPSRPPAPLLSPWDSPPRRRRLRPGERRDDRS